jgi:hypothetical protein
LKSLEKALKKQAIGAILIYEKCAESRLLGELAQLVERRVRNAKARGSNPLFSTTSQWTALRSFSGEALFFLPEKLTRSVIAPLPQKVAGLPAFFARNLYDIDSQSITL